MCELRTSPLLGWRLISPALDIAGITNNHLAELLLIIHLPFLRDKSFSIMLQ